jgi:hypothetical protein
MELSAQLAKRFELEEVFIVPTSVGHTEADTCAPSVKWVHFTWRTNEIPLKGAMIAQSLGDLNRDTLLTLMEWPHRRLAGFPIDHGVDRSMARVGVFFANFTVHSKPSIPASEPSP